MPVAAMREPTAEGAWPVFSASARTRSFTSGKQPPQPCPAPDDLHTSRRELAPLRTQARISRSETRRQWQTNIIENQAASAAHFNQMKLTFKTVSAGILDPFQANWPMCPSGSPPGARARWSCGPTRALPAAGTNPNWAPVEIFSGAHQLRRVQCLRAPATTSDNNIQLTTLSHGHAASGVDLERYER